MATYGATAKSQDLEQGASAEPAGTPKQTQRRKIAIAAGLGLLAVAFVATSTPVGKRAVTALNRRPGRPLGA